MSGASQTESDVSRFPPPTREGCFDVAKHGLSANISVSTLNLSAYLINHCLAVLCKFLGDFWSFWERDNFSQRIG